MGWFLDANMRFYDGCKEILKIQKFRRIVSYAGFYAFTALISYAYTSNTTRAGYSRGDQFYASYPAGTELLTDTTKLYKAALGNCFEEEEWGPIEWLIMAKHFERQGKGPYAYHAVKFGTLNRNRLVSRRRARPSVIFSAPGVLNVSGDNYSGSLFEFLDKLVNALENHP